MTVKELIAQLLEYPMDAIPYVGKGMGPVAEVHAAEGVVPGSTLSRLVMLEPER